MPPTIPEFQLSMPAHVSLAATADPEAGPDDEGRFTAIVGALNQVIPRLFFDIVLRPGCASKSLQERGLPSMLYAHDMAGAVIGTTESFTESDDTFQVTGQLFVAEQRRVQLAYETWIAMTARNGDGRAPLREFSIGFDVNEAAWEVVNGDEVLAVHEMALYEFSPVIVGAARGTGFLRAPAIAELLERFPRSEVPAADPPVPPHPPQTMPEPTPSPVPEPEHDTDDEPEPATAQPEPAPPSGDALAARADRRQRLMALLSD